MQGASLFGSVAAGRETNDNPGPAAKAKVGALLVAPAASARATKRAATAAPTTTPVECPPPVSLRTTHSQLLKNQHIHVVTCILSKSNHCDAWATSDRWFVHVDDTCWVPQRRLLAHRPQTHARQSAGGAAPAAAGRSSRPAPSASGCPVEHHTALLALLDRV